jgi:hypothetical protein
VSEALAAEHFQPVWVGSAGQQLGRTLADSLGMLAAEKPSVVEEELQQGEIFRVSVSAQEEVVAESAVEILDDRGLPIKSC